jgi:restriction endonuclease S subunit
MIWNGAIAGDVFFGFNGALASAMVKVTPITNDLDKKFLYYVLKNNSYYLRSKAYGSTIPHISRLIFENMRIYLPELSEQKAIIKILDCVHYVKQRRSISTKMCDNLLSGTLEKYRLNNLLIQNAK